ncbi:M23 family metallopeptidase [Curtobacterium sp. RRHDQ66]|uniref:M23 family metallopeptidase n=1 Tax=Curtobacterium guangdongense TaxID=3413380 RepID=UPI003BEF6ACE
MTNDGLPMRPRGAARHAANAAVASWTSGAAVPTPAAPEPTPRRDARRVAPTSRRTASRAADPTVRRTPAPVPEATRASRPAVVLPSRRDLRPVKPAPAAVAIRAATQALTLPLRSIGGAISTTQTVPLTATAIAACLFVTVASPQSAMASTPENTVTAVMDTQEYIAPEGVAISVERDDFSVARAPQAARGVVGAAGVPAQGMSVVRPVAGTIPAAGGFGGRWVQGCGACSTNHQGLDFAAPTGTTVVAAMPGTVVSAGVFGGYGNQILLQHADGTQTRYGHLSQIGVRVGQVVAAGEQIGAVGSTGVSTGSHLHFEVIVGGVPRDPAAWLGARGLL